jgi:hypothetical protein
VITFTVRHRYHVGLFPYWIGFSNRTWGGCNRVLDLGFVKIMWLKRSRLGD